MIMRDSNRIRILGRTVKKKPAGKPVCVKGPLDESRWVDEAGILPGSEVDAVFFDMQRDRCELGEQHWDPFRADERNLVPTTLIIDSLRAAVPKAEVWNEGTREAAELFQEELTEPFFNGLTASPLFLQLMRREEKHGWAAEILDTIPFSVKGEPLVFHMHLLSRHVRMNNNASMPHGIILTRPRQFVFEVQKRKTHRVYSVDSGSCRAPSSRTADDGRISFGCATHPVSQRNSCQMIVFVSVSNTM